jgi:hypothetical protein
MRVICLLIVLLIGCPKREPTKTMEELEKERLIEQLVNDEDIIDDLPESDTGSL